MTEQLKTYTLQELYEQPPEHIQYLIGGLLAPGLYILGGAPKVGKSWLALQLCLAVCEGKTFLGHATKQAEVLYLALEDGPQRLHARAMQLTDTAPQGLYLCDMASQVGCGLERQIQVFLKEHPAVKLVVIDTLQKVRCVPHSGMSYGNDYQDVAALKALADQNGVCLLVIHHLRKMPDDDPMNRLSGTNGLNGAADGTLILDRPDRQNKNAVLTATGRDIEDLEEELLFEDCRWQLVTAADKLRQDNTLRPLQSYLLANKAFDGTATELAGALENYGCAMDAPQLSKYIQAHDAELAKAGIQVKAKRDRSQRTLHLELCEEEAQKYGA